MTQTAVYSPIRNRIYIRKFDYDECRSLYTEGVTVRELAQRYGVSDGAVRRVIDEEFARRMDERSKAHTHTVCAHCGERCLTVALSRRANATEALCRACEGRTRRAGVRLNTDGSVAELNCQGGCHEWKPPEAFGRGKRYPDLREGGFASTCKACLVERRTEYRNRHKIPCEGGCGTLVEGRGRPNSRTAKDGRRDLDPNRPYLCRRCYLASVKKAAT